jgi:pimeloyl-ACP methyl ester carboxylesterase
MSHGFSALKEMDLNTFAEHFIAQIPIHCLVYDNRGFGDSDVAEGEPRCEIVPMIQCSDMSDAITYAATRPEVNPDKIGIWGSSYSGGHVLYVGAADRRVKAVLSQVPCVSGWDNFKRLVRGDFEVGFNAAFAAGEITTVPNSLHSHADKLDADRQARLGGQEPGLVPVVDADPLKPSALPTPDSYEFFSAWEKKSNWKNSVTMRT